jgi:hypothetical protein
MPTIGRSASHAPRRIWSSATGTLAQGGDRLLQRLAPPIPTYTRRPPSYNGVGGGRRYRVSSLGRSGRRPIPPDTPADRSTSLSLTQRLVRAPSAHRLGFSFLSGGFSVRVQWPAAIVVFAGKGPIHWTRDAAGSIIVASKAGRFPARRLSNVLPVHALVARLPLASRTLGPDALALAGSGVA